MNILIIDDEPLVLQTVHKQVQEMELGFEKIDVANSTKLADQMMEDTEYDIFLCDIVMPEEDGISFAKRVLSSWQQCKFIFLTAHADFAYMKEAISIQSFDYVLQPTTKEELRHVIERAIKQLKIERKNRHLEQLGSLFIDNQMDILDGNAMRYLIGLTDNQSFLEHLVENQTGDSAYAFRILPVFAHIIESERVWREQERNLLRGIYYNIVDELTDQLNSQNVIILRSDKLGNFILLLCFAEDSSYEIERVKGVLDNIRIVFEKSLKIRMALYYSGSCHFQDLRSMCQDIIKEQSNNVAGGMRVYQVGQLSSLDINEHSLDAQTKVWKSFLKNRELQQFQSAVLRFLNYKENINELNQEIMLRLHQTVNSLLVEYMVNHNINSADVFTDGITYTDFMYCWNNSDEFAEILNRIIDHLCKLEGENDVVAIIANYIEHNIDKDILVSEIADHVGMNPEYLTRLFKKETGQSLKKFMEHKKMDMAKDLLTTTTLSVTEVADRVGYSGYSNFSRSFKQLCGCSPSEYRDHSQSQKMLYKNSDFE